MAGRHIHVSVLDGVITMGYVLVGLYLLRLLSVKMSDTSFGQALAFIVN